LIIKELPVGPIMANCFIVGCEDTHESVVIDPGDEPDRILLELADLKLKVKYILNTHCHFDHVGGNSRMKEVTGADILIHSLDASMLTRMGEAAMGFGLRMEDSPPADRELSEGDVISFGRINFQVIHTPGHSPGGISFYAEDSVFVGDTLFAGSIGRTDFPGGNYDTLIASVREKLFVLGDEVTVYCGHGPQTTIGREKRYNPFF